MTPKQFKSQLISFWDLEFSREIKSAGGTKLKCNRRQNFAKCWSADFRLYAITSHRTETPCEQTSSRKRPQEEPFRSGGCQWQSLQHDNLGPDLYYYTIGIHIAPTVFLSPLFQPAEKRRQILLSFACILGCLLFCFISICPHKASWVHRWHFWKAIMGCGTHQQISLPMHLQLNLIWGGETSGEEVGHRGHGQQGFVSLLLS